ncbi:membrane protein [Gordonia phage Clown]|uniref:Membrane protein n=1 Tax=Gordonia phage Clown TaxID=2759393 RepID=A0A7L7SU60_9CAUD|nr:membrane protein [Gordonia phage Clown]QOC56045.1 membrane protein [Gordonia phage Clown]
MPSWLTPDALDNLTVGTLVVFGAILFIIANNKRWIVLRWQHLEAIALRDQKIAEQRELIAGHAEAIAIKDRTIADQAETIRNNTATGEGALKMLQTFRDLTAGGGGGS